MAGTGKTALALGVLRSLEKREKILYLCTRASPSSVIRDHPWLGDVFDVSPKHRKVMDEGELEDVGIFVDGRLDEPATLFERITDELMNTPRPTIVIDSWDSVADMMEKEAYYSNTRMLQSWRDKTRARLILIVEDPSDTTFDYLVDGVIVLRRGIWDGRVLREIYLSKLIGVDVERPSYYYTLKGSFFRCFMAQSNESFALPSFVTAGGVPAPHRPSVAVRGRLETGFEELDVALGGGLAPRSVVLLELDPTVDPKVISLLVGRLAAAAAGSGVPVGVGLFGLADPVYTKRFLGLSLPPPSMELVSITPSAGATLKKRSSDSEGRGAWQSSVKEWKTGMTKTSKGGLAILSYGSDRSGLVATVAGLVRELTPNSSSVVVCSPYSGGQAPFPVDVRLRLQERKGTIFFKSDIPWTKLYGVTVDRSGGVPRIGLEPVV